jgi:hypothetical protein
MKSETHTELADRLGKEVLTPDVRKEEEDAARRLFVLQVIQPGLAGLMDGSVSTLAPLFAAAFATHNSLDAFRVGLAASIGAGISMGFAEALSDDGSLTGRGHPWIRGVVCGLMTTLGGIGHTMPYLIPSFRVATAVAVIVVAMEWRHLVDPQPLHGHAARLSCDTSRRGRRARVPGGDSDRQRVIVRETHATLGPS